MQNPHTLRVDAMMDTDFSPASNDAGSALQQAWMGTCLLGAVPVASSRRHSNITSCTADVRRTLYASDRPLKLADLHDATGHDKMAIGSVLTKLQATGDVLKIPADSGRNYNAGYRWTGRDEPVMRRARSPIR